MLLVTFYQSLTSAWERLYPLLASCYKMFEIFLVCTAPISCSSTLLWLVPQPYSSLQVFQFLVDLLVCLNHCHVTGCSSASTLFLEWIRLTFSSNSLLSYKSWWIMWWWDNQVLCCKSSPNHETSLDYVIYSCIQLTKFLQTVFWSNIKYQIMSLFT